VRLLYSPLNVVLYAATAELLSNYNDLLLSQQYSTTIRAAALYVRVQASGKKERTLCWY
jgi:hypothetical protein